nr:HNH endonuclease signature motif containing protein [Exiguobacterium acetylicum]
MPDPFQAKSGNALDVHHLLRLSDGGPDHPEHVAAICPNCHARIYRGEDGKELNQQLIAKIRAKEEAYVKSERIF